MGSHRSARFAFRALPLIFSALIVFEAATHRVSAWSDEGHMLVAAVAKLVLPADTVAKVESLLHKWDVDFPGVGRMETSAVWLDHLSCREQVPHCGGFKSLDDVQLFRAWHYSNRVLNPQEIELEGVYKFYPLPETGAEWALQTTYKSLTEAEAALALPAPMAQIPGDKDALVPFRRGSNFSLNLHLRLLLHVFGDLHQPLHACSLFARGFPKGDEGGNEITIAHPAHARNLHYLWDSGGLVFTKPFFNIQWDELAKQATEIMEEYPRETLQKRLSGKLSGDNFHAIADESEEIAMNVAYSEFDWKTFSKDSLPYAPSPEYIETVRKVSREQIAVAGYRLAYVLALIAPHLPSPMSRKHISTFHSLQDALAGLDFIEEWKQFRLAAARQHIPLDADDAELDHSSDASRQTEADLAADERNKDELALDAKLESEQSPEDVPSPEPAIPNAKGREEQPLVEGFLAEVFFTFSTLFDVERAWTVMTRTLGNIWTGRVEDDADHKKDISEAPSTPHLIAEDVDSASETGGLLTLSSKEL